MRLCDTRLLLAILLFAVLGAAGAPGTVAGQDPDSARAVLGRESLCPDAQVQVSTTFGERFRGRCVLQDARLLVVRDGVEQPVLYTAVDSVWMRGPGTRAGAVTGAWIGAGFGGALGALFIVALCEVECRNDYIGYTLGGAAAGALTGGAVGGLIGRRTRIWMRLYPR